MRVCLHTNATIGFLVSLFEKLVSVSLIQWNKVIDNLITTPQKNNAAHTMEKEGKRFVGKTAGIILDSIFLKRKRESQEEFFRYCTMVTSTTEGMRLGKVIQLC